MNMCGTDGPYGSAVTSDRFSRLASRRARKVWSSAEDQCDAQGGQHGAEHVSGRHGDDADHQAGQGEDVDQDVEAETEEGVECRRGSTTGATVGRGFLGWAKGRRGERRSRCS